MYSFTLSLWILHLAFFGQMLPGDSRKAFFESKSGAVQPKSGKVIGRYDQTGKFYYRVNIYDSTTVAGRSVLRGIGAQDFTYDWFSTYDDPGIPKRKPKQTAALYFFENSVVFYRLVSGSEFEKDSSLDTLKARNDKNYIRKNHIMEGTYNQANEKNSSLFVLTLTTPSPVKKKRHVILSVKFSRSSPRPNTSQVETGQNISQSSTDTLIRLIEESNLYKREFAKMEKKDTIYTVEPVTSSSSEGISEIFFSQLEILKIDYKPTWQFSRGNNAVSIDASDLFNFGTINGSKKATLFFKIKESPQN